MPAGGGDAAERLKLFINSAGKPSRGLRRRWWCEAAYSLGLDAKTAQRRAWAEVKTVDNWPALP